MKTKLSLWLGLSILFVLMLTGVVLADQDEEEGQRALARVRRATTRYHRVEVAVAAGYDLVEGLDHCFDNPGVGGMGFHYINQGLDLKLNALRPEAMVTLPDRMGNSNWGQSNTSCQRLNGTPRAIPNRRRC